MVLSLVDSTDRTKNVVLVVRPLRLKVSDPRGALQEHGKRVAFRRFNYQPEWKPGISPDRSMRPLRLTASGKLDLDFGRDVPGTPAGLQCLPKQPRFTSVVHVVLRRSSRWIRF